MGNEWQYELIELVELMLFVLIFGIMFLVTKGILTFELGIVIVVNRNYLCSIHSGMHLNN